MRKKGKFLVIIFLLFFAEIFSYTRMFLDTIYEVKYVNYENLDFNNSTSTDSSKKIYSILNTSLKVNIDSLEFKLGFCSIGEWGRRYDNHISTFVYSWQKNLPYPDTNFMPWISELYVKYFYKVNIKFLDIKDINLIFTIGRQRKDFVEGLVLGDNGVGYDGFSFSFNLDKYFYIESLYSRVDSEGVFMNDRYFDLYSYIVGSRFYDGFDFGMCSTIENCEFFSFKKVFYEFFIRRVSSSYSYVFEYAIQAGKSDTEEYSGSLWFLKATTHGKNKYLGNSQASLVWLLSSGGENSNIFNPSFSKRYYFLEPYGYGEFSKANINSIFFDLPQGYSGIFILGFDLSINPLKNFFAEMRYYLLSSPVAPDDRPEPTATEKVLGAKKAIGIEYNIDLKYKISEFLNVGFVYSIFNPTKGAYQNKLKDDSATKLGFYVKSKF